MSTPYDNTLPDASAAGQHTSNAGGNTLAILRKINLSVDIATQAELISVYNELSGMIQDSGTAWKAADVQLSNDLKAWAKGSELSGALQTSIDAEETRAKAAEDAIRDSLSAYALSTTVADAYKVSVSTAAEGDHDNYVYTVTQGGTAVGTIDIAKDQFVSAAHFDGTILVLDLRNGDVISTDLSGFVDVYEGSEDTEVKVTTTDNTISVELLDTIARVGTSSDLSTANTIYGAKKYADTLVSDKNVDAEGDGTYITASAANNKVTVLATEALSNAVTTANSAVQSVSGETETGALITASRSGNDVALASSAKLTAAVAAAETALQAISVGTNSTYISAVIGAKDGNHNQTVGINATVASLNEVEVSHGLAEATDVKTYVDTQTGYLVGTTSDISSDDTIFGAKAYADVVAAQAVTDLSVTIAGDTLVSATTANGKALTVGATNALTSAVTKANSAVQNISEGDGFINFTDKDDNNVITGYVITGEVSSETAGLAVNTDVKQYVDDLVGTPLSGVIVNGSSLNVDNRVVSLTIASGVDNGTIRVNEVDVSVTGLGSAAYTLSSAYDKAGNAAALQTAVKNAVNDARFDTAATDDYQDIEDIIEDLVKVRQALGALKALNVTLTPAAS